jgi:uncharacterized protein YfaS (alpha-2-macroglobulin family)
MRRSVLAAISLLGIASFALFTSYSRAQSGHPAMSAFCSGGSLHLSLVTRTALRGEATLLVEILDPEDRVVGHVERSVFAGAGEELREPDLAIPVSLAADELVWHRLRYRIVYKDPRSPMLEEISSLSRILHRPSVHVLSQPTYLSGGPAAVRLVVTEPGSDAPITNGGLQIDLVSANAGVRRLYSGRLNSAGTTSAEFRFPASLTGAYSLRYAVDTPQGEATYTQPIHLEDQSGILLSTEKPVYQPGQTIHVRALALDRATHKAVALHHIMFEMEDARGNKVFRKATQTDTYGIASAEFTLADEVNLGAWPLHASMDQASGTPSRAEITLNVERYVLPRFKVALDMATKDAKAKHGYRPGDHITGTVHANYFFGKPVDHAEVAVTASGRDVAKFEAGKSAGTTDAEGAYRFDIALPDFFAGRPLNNNAALVLLEATVKDNAGHSESRAEPVTVSESPILITAIPEAELIAPGLPNRLFVVTAYADGAPARTDLRVRGAGASVQTISTDDAGVAVVPLTAAVRPAEQLRIEAKDRDGNSAVAPVTLQVSQSADQLLLQADRAIYKPGDRINIQIFSLRQRGSVYIDLLKDRQTIATHDVEMTNGHAALEIPVTAGMAGTVELSAYLFGRDGQPSGDRRLLFIQPADDLHIETSLDAPVHKPGDEAHIAFRVTNRRGEGVAAALGVEIVDQAVFALAEKQPGFAKVFFYLEQETMKPRYEIHSLNIPDVISSADGNRAAQALFAAAGPVQFHRTALEFGSKTPQEKFAAYQARYQRRFEEQANRLVEQVAGRNGSCGQTLPAVVPLAGRTADAWGNPISVDSPYGGTRYFRLRSAGPDGLFNTSDDLIHQVQDPECSGPGSITVRLDSGHGANGFGEIGGVVQDASGASVPGTVVQITEVSSGRTHTVRTEANGAFRFSSLAAGAYTVSAEAIGFATARQRFSLNEGDRALLTVRLAVGAMTETVAVEAAAGMVQMNMAAAAPMKRREAAPIMAKDAMAARSVALAGPAMPSAAETHVRSWFPESLYVAPEIITDRTGHAAITVPIADNITTWRMAMLASTASGAMGSSSSSLKVFQNFFAEMDLPVTLTQGDEVSIPVAVYNYSGAPGSVRLQLDAADWFSMENDTPQKSIAIESDRVGASQFTIAAKRIGKFKLTLRAALDGASKRADIVVREIEVVPNGREQNIVFNGRLDSVARQEIRFPSSAIPEANAVLVRLYPGPMSQILEGMDALLRMPGGCFEQTSSSTYPNVLALDYMKRTKKVTPEISAKAEGYISSGYQRLVTFEVRGGGFSWFGQAPANKILTAYGLMEFADMSKVHDVDPRLIERTQAWLAGQQQPDGSWKPDTQFINEGATNRFNNDVLRITAYIAWALETTGYGGPAVERARQYVAGHLASSLDAYTLAVAANLAVDGGHDRAFTDQSIRLLLDLHKEEGDKAWWKADETSVYATGDSAAIETTGLAVQALIKSNSNSAIAAKAMNFIASKKNAQGAWGTTQATIMALRGLLLASEKGSATAKGALEVVLNGKSAATLDLNEQNNDLYQQYVFRQADGHSTSDVELRFRGQGTLAYQIVGRYFTPWNVRPAGEPLSIDVTYDRTRLEQDQIATATATVRNNLGKVANMVMLDLGIPPGFDLLSEDLDSYREKTARQKTGRLEKYSLTATQAILYFDAIPASGKLTLSFRLRAKYPIRASTFASRVYEYYTPEINSAAAPVRLEVRKR